MQINPYNRQDQDRYSRANKPNHSSKSKSAQQISPNIRQNQDRRSKSTQPFVKIKIDIANQPNHSSRSNSTANQPKQSSRSRSAYQNNPNIRQKQGRHCKSAQTIVEIKIDIANQPKDTPPLSCCLVVSPSRCLAISPSRRLAISPPRRLAVLPSSRPAVSPS